MSAIKNYVDQITQKLRHDRELQLDIAHELQTHLDEAVEEYKASEYEEDQAIEQAIRDMGDADELAEDIWQSNRFRMKLRAWCWWIARLTLWPTCVMVTLAFLISGVGYTGVLRSAKYRTQAMPMESPQNLAEYSQQLFENQMRSKMTATQRLIAFGDEQARNKIKRWKALRDTFPDEPLYQMKYILTIFSGSGKNPAKKDWDVEPEQLLSEFQRGAKLDPENGIYDLLHALISLPEVKYHDDKTISIQTPSVKDGSLETDYPYVFEKPQDLQKIQKIVSLLRDAVGHEYICAHEWDVLRHRMEQLPQARSIREYMFRVTSSFDTNLPMLRLNRKLSRYVGAAAIQHAKNDEVDEALVWLGLLDRWQHKMAASSSTLIELLVVSSIRFNNDKYRSFVYEISGKKDARDLSIQKMTENAYEWKHEYHDRLKDDTPEFRNLRKRAGMVMGMLLPVVPGYQIDVAPFRMAEYATLDRGALTFVLLFLLMISGVFSFASVWRLCFTKSCEHKPLLLWVGFRRLAILVLGCVVLPVIVFALMAQTPLLGRQWGMDRNLFNICWYVSLFISIIILLWHCGSNAMRMQASALGLVVPQARTFKPLVVMLVYMFASLILSGFIFYLWQPSGEHMNTFFYIGVFFMVLGLVGGWVMMAYEIGWLHGNRRWFSAAMVSLLWSFLAMYGLAVLLSVLVYLTAHPSDLRASITMVFVFCLPASFVIALFQMGKKQSSCKLFAASVVRSMSLLWLVSALVLVVFVGSVLRQIEAHYAKQMIAQSPIFIDMEVERSDIRLLKEKWANGEPTAPRMMPVHDANK